MIRYRFNCEEIMGLEKGIEYTSAVRGFETASDGIPVHVRCDGEGFSLKECNGEIYISYEKKIEFFRALGLATGMLEEGKTNFSINEKPSFDLCGAMLDCSRNGILKPEIAINYFAYMALMGLNCVMLYTEDTYEVEGYPYFGYMRGRYSIDELKRLDDAAADLGIELIPCIQTLAHLKNTLRWGFAKDIRDNEDVLLIDEEGTYKFIEAMFKSLKKCFKSTKIHIGMDEASGVGLGEYLQRNGFCDRFETLSHHLNRVCEIAENHGLEPMMWSDMFFKLGSVTGEYYDTESKFPENISELIPKNVSMVYWDYYHDNKEFYLSMMNGHKKLERDIFFAGGVWTWRGMGPGYDKTIKTTIPALEACVETGIRNVIATSWGDGGTEVSVLLNLLGMQLYAECCYGEETRIDNVNERFAMCTGLNPKLFTAVALDDISDKVKMEEDFAPVSRIVLYQDVLCGLFDKNLSMFDMETVYNEELECLKGIGECGRFELFKDYYIALVKVLKQKCGIGLKIREAYRNKDNDALKEFCIALEKLLEDYKKFHNMAYELWHRFNKPFGYDKFDGHLGTTEARILCAKKRLEEYLSGKIEKIDEFEEELLWYGSEKSIGIITCDNAYKNISSASSEY